MPPPAGAIEHVVVLMLENCSFDFVLGFLKEQYAGPFEGLTGAEEIPRDPRVPGSPLVRITRSGDDDWYRTDPDPGHAFADVQRQLEGGQRGFIADYRRKKGVTDATAVRVFRGLDPGVLRVIPELARAFTVCDHWFASVPGPTWPNRFFVHAASSGGYQDNPSPGEMARSQGFGSPFRMRTIYEALQEAGRTWTVYFEDMAQTWALGGVHGHVERFHRLDGDPERGHPSFEDDVAGGALAAYSFIEPQYFSVPGNPANDQHPPHDFRNGERLIARVYDTLRSNDAVWQTSLLVVLWDEHGGLYDHVPPPAAVPPGDTTPAPNAFAFDRLGVRVPALLVSPWAARGGVDSTVYDHASVPATLARLFGLPGFLTARDAAASTFDGALLDAPRARDDTPADLRARVGQTTVGVGSTHRPPTDHQRGLVALGTGAAEKPPTEYDAALRIAVARAALIESP